MSFSDNLRCEMDFCGFTAKALAAKSGVNINTLNHYLSGRNSMPPADVAVNLAAALGVTVEFLVTSRCRDSAATATVEEMARMQAHIEQCVALCREYADVLRHLQTLPAYLLAPIKAMIRAAATDKAA